MWTKTQKILAKKFEIDKTMFENLVNHDVSKLYSSNLVYSRYIGPRDLLTLGSVNQLYTSLEVYNLHIHLAASRLSNIIE